MAILTVLKYPDPLLRQRALEVTAFDIQLSKTVEEKYGMAPTLTGHSLAGYLAEQGAKSTPSSDVYTYNKAAGFPSIFSSTPKNQYDYRTSLDIPSALSQFQSGNRTTLPGSWNPIDSHDIKYLKL